MSFAVSKACRKHVSLASLIGEVFKLISITMFP
jgi:hypothetical protein